MCTSARCATVSDKSMTINDKGLEATFQQSTARRVILEGLSMPRYESKVQNKVQHYCQSLVPVSASLAQKAPITIAKRHRHCSYLSQLYRLLLYRFLSLNPATVAGPPGSLQLRLHVVESCCRSQSWDELPACVACSESWSQAQTPTCARHSGRSR